MKCYFCGKRIVASKNRYSLFPYEICSIDEKTCCKKCYKKEVEPTIDAIKKLSENNPEYVMFYKDGKVREEFPNILVEIGNPDIIKTNLVSGYDVIFNKDAQSFLDVENKGIKSVFGVTILGNVLLRRKK